VHTPLPRILSRPRAGVVAAIVAVGLVPAAHATVTTYVADLSGPNESPPNDSPGTGFAEVTHDDEAHTMHLVVTFEGLIGTVTAAHIHGPTAVPGEGNAGVATTTPTFPGFPAGVTAGTYNATFDLTDSASYNAAFLNANGGSPEAAEAALFASIAAGTAYFNIHTTQWGGGEIRGFLASETVPVTETTWGALKALFE